MKRTIIALFAVLAASWTAQAQTINFKIGMATTADSPQNVAAVKLVDLLRERTNGEINGQVFHSGSLGSTDQLLQSMALGTVDATVTVAIDTYVPQAGIFLLPYLFRDQDHFYKVADSALSEEIFADSVKRGLRIASIWDSGFRQIYMVKKPIESFDDLKGAKIRVPGGQIWIDTFRAFNVNATPMAYGEVFTALEQGVIDGMEQPIPNFASNKFFEVAKHMAKVDYMAGPAFFVVSERFWQGLSDENKKIFADAMNEAKALERTLNQKSEDKDLADMQAQGLMISEPDLAPFREAARTVWAPYEEKFGKDVIQKIVDME